jgi:CubicO group peptidase (beta-lactamase class C family)
MLTTNRIDETLERATQSGSVPGVVAAAATDRGVVYHGAFGRRSLDDATPMTLDSVFRIASMTKAVTSVAAMQLVERGKVGLDEPLGHLVPALAAPEVFEGFDAGGSPRLRPARTAVTLRHLLTHTSGYAYEIWHAELARYLEHASIPSATTAQRTALRAPLTFEPGERWFYGINTDFVGQVVEAVDGRTLDAYFEQEIFAPLGMRDTSFRIRPDQQARLVTVHARDDSGALATSPFEWPQGDFAPGGHGLYSTASDYLQFLQMLLHRGRFNGATLLQPATVDEMAKNQIGDLQIPALKTAMPPFSNDVDLGPDLKWGLGFLINETAQASGRAAGTLSWAGVFNSYFWIDPANRVTGVILTQILPFFDGPALALYAGFERALYDSLDL